MLYDLYRQLWSSDGVCMCMCFMHIIATTRNNCICSWHGHGQWLTITGATYLILVIVCFPLFVASIQQNRHSTYSIHWTIRQSSYANCYNNNRIFYTSFDCAIRCNIYSSYIFVDTMLLAFSFFFSFFLLFSFRMVTILVW